MTTRKLNVLWVAMGVLALTVGCGDSGGGGASGSAGPTPSQKSAAQTAGAAGTPTSKTAEIATDAIVENGASGSTAPKTGSQVHVAATTTINYQASISVT